MTAKKFILTILTGLLLLSPLLAANLTLKKKEAKTVTFTIKDADGDIVDVTLTTMTFVMKENIRGSALVTKNDSDFNKVQSTSGIVSFVLDSTDTNRDGHFMGELKIVFSTSNIDKSGIIDIEILKSITD